MHRKSAGLTDENKRLIRDALEMLTTDGQFVAPSAIVQHIKRKFDGPYILIPDIKKYLDSLAPEGVCKELNPRGQSRYGVGKDAS